MLSLSESIQVFNTVDGSVMPPAHWQPHERCVFLESGGILFWETSPFLSLAPDDLNFLLGQHQSGGRHFKNIAYRPLSDKLTGAKTASESERQRLQAIMRSFSENAVAFVQECLSPYRDHLRLDYASFRPIEERDRDSRRRADNRLLHVDSFPTRPTRGDRILRFFTNIHPTENRVWRTSDCFETLVRRYQSEFPAYPLRKNHLKAVLQRLGLSRSERPDYDQWMLRFHHFLKENQRFQDETRKDVWEFPPGSSWMVYTDMVSHSVLSGKYALEQTFIVGHDGMVQPDHSPLRTLQRIFLPAEPALR